MPCALAIVLERRVRTVCDSRHVYKECSMSWLPTRRHRVALAAAAVAAVVAAALVPGAGGAARAAAGNVDPSLYAALKWRNIGPNTGGRVLAVAGSAARPNEYYFGATGGGLWKTTDGRTTGRLSPMARSPVPPSARSRSAPATRTWCTSAWARPLPAGTSSPATASIRPQTEGRPGRISGSTTPR